MVQSYSAVNSANNTNNSETLSSGTLSPETLSPETLAAESIDSRVLRAEQSNPGKFQRILVALDRSEAMATILQRVMAIAPAPAPDQSSASPQAPAQVCLFTCLSEPPTPLPGATGFIGLGLYDAYATASPALLRESWEHEVQGCEQWLSAQAEALMRQGLVVEYAWTTGDPGAAICEKARDWQADLIVVGRRGRQGLTEMILGSVSNAVVHHGPCSVLIVQ